MIDKRQQRRFFKRYRVEFSADNRIYRGITVNFSLNGLYIRTNKPLSHDTSLDIAVHLPDGSTSRLHGKVVRTRKTLSLDDSAAPYRTSDDGIGVSVTEKDAGFLHLIRSLLSDRTVSSGKIRRDDRLDTWVWKGLKKGIIEVAPGEYEAFALEMQQKFGTGCYDLP